MKKTPISGLPDLPQPQPEGLYTVAADPDTGRTYRAPYVHSGHITPTEEKEKWYNQEVVTLDVIEPVISLESGLLLNCFLHDEEGDKMMQFPFNVYSACVVHGPYSMSLDTIINRLESRIAALEQKLK